MMDFDKLGPAEKFMVLALAVSASSEGKDLGIKFYGNELFLNYVPIWKRAGLTAISLELARLSGELDAICDGPPLFSRSHLLAEITALSGLIEFANAKPIGEDLVCAVAKILCIAPRYPFEGWELKARLKETLKRYGYRNLKEFKRWIRNENLGRALSGGEFSQKVLGYVRENVLPNIYCGNDLWLPDDIPNTICGSIADQDAYVKMGFRRTSAGDMCDLAHLFVPGHTFMALMRKALLVKERIGRECEVDLPLSAETTVVEGVASLSHKIFPDLFLGEYQTVAVVAEYRSFVAKLLYNVWYHRFIEQTMSEIDAGEYVMDATGFTEREAKELIAHMDEHRIKFPAYSIGAELIEKYLDTAGEAGIRFLFIPKPACVLDALAEFAKKNTNKTPCLGGKFVVSGACDEKNDPSMLS